MIKGLMGIGNVVVDAGNTSIPYVNYNSNNPMQGMIRISGSDLQVFDGASWITINTSYATVKLTGEAEDALHWVQRKRDEERKLELLAKDNPTVAIALDNVKKAEEQLKITILLSKDEEQTTS